MKAYIFTRKDEIKLRDIPAPSLQAGSAEDARSAILKPRYISPCSSDVHTVYAGAGPRRDNLVLGHEGLAEVVEVGAEVRDFKPGELVAVSAVMPEPGDLTGHKGAHFSGSKLGRNINGMWAELFKVPDADMNLAHIPEDVSLEAALMAVDMMATGYTAASEALIEQGQTICVIGSGAVGLMAASAAKRMTGSEGQVMIVGSDKDPIHAELAQQFDIDTYISYRDGSIVYDNWRGQSTHEAIRDANGCAGSLSENAAGAGDGASTEMDTGEAANGAYNKLSSERSTNNTASEAAFVNSLLTQATSDSRANSTGSSAVDTVLTYTGGCGVDAVLVCGGGAEELAKASDIVKYGTGIIVNVAYIEGDGMIGLPIFSLGRGMSGKTFKFELSRGGRDWLEAMLDEAARCESMQGALVTDRLHGFESIPEALKKMRERPSGTVKIMVEVSQ